MRHPIVPLALVLVLGAALGALVGYGGEDARPAAPPAASPPARATPADVAKFLAGWAEAVGKDIDSTTGYPKRVKRTKDSMVMVLIPAGTFQMGAVPGDEHASEDEKPRHAVTLSKPYYMDESEVTVGMWKKYAAEAKQLMPLDTRDEKDDSPVNDVSWTDVQRYLVWADVELPTEAQWERAAKGGHDEFVFPWGVTDNVKNRNGMGSDDGFDEMSPTKSFAANDFGLYDMSGSVEEWCADGKRTYEAKAVTDPVGPAKWNSRRVLRGGSWVSGSVLGLRASARQAGELFYANGFYGFRCARSVP